MLHADDLKKTPLFACLTDAQRERIAASAADLRLQEGEWLIREGETPWFYVFLEGSFEIEKEYGGVRPRTVRRYATGDFFGETPILLDSPTIGSVRACEASRVLRLDRTQFKELIDSSPECSNRIIKVMMDRITSIRENNRDSNPLRVQVVGSPIDEECREVRAFLSRNRIPFEWTDPAREGDLARPLPSRPHDMPGSFAVIDRTTFVGAPLTARKVAEAIGIRTEPAHETYDVLVIGGGPAGLAAAVYGSSEGLKVLLVERSAVGGQAGSSSRIENYLGFPSGISGDELSTRALKQATRLGSEIVMTGEVVSLESLDGGYCVTLDGGERLKARAVVIATGVEWRRLEVEGLERFAGRGLLYGAARTEATTVVGKDVFIVGGGNSAGQAAMFFSSYARSVTVLVRGPGLAATMSQYLIDQLAQQHNVTIEPHTQVVGARGREGLDTIVTSTKGAPGQSRPADALFLMIGALAKTDWLPASLQRDKNGFICTGIAAADASGKRRAPFLLETNLPGIFCAGDVRAESIKRVASGVGEGSMAIAFVHQYLALSVKPDAAA